MSIREFLDAGAPPDEGDAWPRSGGRRGAPPGSVVGGARRRRIGRGSASRGGRRKAPPGRARRCLAPTRSGQKLHVSQRRGDPLGRPRPFMPTRSFMAGTNKSRGDASGGGRPRPPPDRARQCLAPTRSGQKLHVSQRRGDPLGRPRSFMPTRSFTAGTNKSRGGASRGGRRGAPPDTGEAVPRPYAVRLKAPCVPT